MKKLMVLAASVALLGAGCTAKLSKEDMGKIDDAVSRTEAAANKAEMAAKSAADAAARAEAAAKKVDAVFAKGLHKK